MTTTGEMAGKTCVPCSGGLPPMSHEEAMAHLPAVPGWTLEADPPRLARKFRFKDFNQAQHFAVKVGDICEAEGHHAEIAYGWGHCTVQFWTHKINGLHVNDFVMAAKVNGLPFG